MSKQTVSRAAIAAALLGLVPTCGEAREPRITGDAETVFDWERARCGRWDIPDAPARAWRMPDGGVALLAGSENTRASRGSDLESLERDCAVLHSGAGADDPAAFDDKAWIASLHAGGTRLEALAHAEYHGHLRPDRCAGDYMACWSNAIVALESEDGRTFRRPDGRAVVATLPYRYDGDAAGRIGYFNPSNILQVGPDIYVFVFAEAYRAQARGPCLLRRPIDGRPADWRGWDGSRFSVAFVDPYQQRVNNPVGHVCAPIPGLDSTISSVVRHAGSGRFLAVTPAERRDANGRVRGGIWWTASDNLRDWTEPKLLLEVPLLWSRDCDRPAAFAYPSLIDAESTSRNFDTVDSSFWLYLVEMPLDEACRVGPRRNLIRLPVSWPGE
jgi:hypothetical protein